MVLSVLVMFKSGKRERLFFPAEVIQLFKGELTLEAPEGEEIERVIFLGLEEMK